MSFYISDRQVNHNLDVEQPFAPILLEAVDMHMKYRVFPPEFEFHHILMDSYEFCNSAAGATSFSMFPAGCISLVFLLGNTPSAEVCGITTTIKQIPIPPQSTAFFLRLSPGGFGGLSNICLSDLTNQSFALEQFLPNIDTLSGRLRRAESFHERNVLFQHFLASLHAEKFRPHAIIPPCINEIYERRGNVRVSELAQSIGCSERYLNRMFQNHVGVSTKTFCGLVQLQASLRCIFTTHTKSLREIAVAFGYFDQPHMNRAYRNFLGCTAGDMRYAGKTELRLVKRSL